MSDAYVECLVQSKQSGIMKFLKGLLLTLGIIFAALTLLFPMGIWFILAIVFFVAVWFVGYFADIEYEYLYIDRELTVDKIMKKSKRKRVATYSLDRMEILAPVKSYHLDNFKNRQVKVKDYSIREELQPDLRYAMYYEGGLKIILSPSESLIKAMKNAAPRKVFAD